MALIIADDLKSFVGISGTSEDDKLTLIVAGVDRAAKRFMRRDIERQSYTDVLLNGTGRGSLYLPQRPLISVESLKVAAFFGAYGGVGNDEAFTADTEWTQNLDFIIRDNRENEENQAELVAIRRPFLRGYANVKVSYTAGYSTVPDDIKLACYLTAARVRAGAVRGGPLANESLGDYSYQLLASDRSGEICEARSILKHYRQIVV